MKRTDNQWLLTQSCLDCHFIPSKKQITSNKQWSIKELQEYRDWYEKNH